jgi:hypothetical protein
MSRAKLILTGVTLFAVVGGTFAFKVKRGVTAFCRISNQTGPCTTTLNNVSFSALPPTQGLTTYCTTNILSDCSVPVRTFLRQ